MGKWLAGHKVLAGIAAAALVLPALAFATLILVQPVHTNPAAQVSDVTFSAGDDYTAINDAGFATVTVANGGSTVTMDVKGVPGAVSVTLGDVLKVTNNDATEAYTATLAASGTINAAITSFIVTVKDSLGATVASWDAVDGTPADATFPLAATEAYDVSLLIVVTTGTAVGSLGTFDLQLTSTLV